jgi:hypothetical protein
VIDMSRFAVSLTARWEAPPWQKTDVLIIQRNVPQCQAGYPAYGGLAITKPQMMGH